LLAAGHLDPTPIVSHRIPLADAARGYELFCRHEATKVVLIPESDCICPIPARSLNLVIADTSEKTIPTKGGEATNLGHAGVARAGGEPTCELT
jgi:hypothetical protein